MRGNYFGYSKCCTKREGGIWKMVSAVLFVIAAMSAISAALLKVKNCKYRDKIIEMSKNFPNTPEQEAELEEIRKREWSRAHAPSNQQTTEERMAENRVMEEA